MIDRLTERQRAAQALNTAADLMTTTAALIEQGEDVEADRGSSRFLVISGVLSVGLGLSAAAVAL